jgi:hypothetical protein
MQQEFSKKVLTYESLIAASAIGDGLDLRQFLGFEREYKHLANLSGLPHSNAGVITSSLSPRNKTMLINLLVSYRILDIAANIEGYPELPIRYEKKKDIGILNSFPLFDRLENWPPIVTEFGRVVATSVNIVSTDINNKQPASLNKQITTLKKLMSSRAVGTSLINIQLAVISLHRLLNEVSPLMPILGLSSTS